MSPSDKPFLSFVAPPELLERIDDYRFAHRFQTRAAAIKFLLEHSLKQNPAPPGKAKPPARKARKATSK